MPTSQRSKDSLKTVQDIFLRSERSVLQGSPFVRLAGFSGFSATVLMVYRNFLLENEKKGYDKAVAEAGLIEGPPRMIKLASSDADATNKNEEIVRLENLSEESEKRTRKMVKFNEYLNEQQMKQQFQKMYDSTNNFHFLHTFALMAAPLARKPALTGTLMFFGMTLSCGSGYYIAIKGPLLMAAPSGGKDAAKNIRELEQGKKTNGYTAVEVANWLGGIMIVVAWLTFVL